VNHPALVEPDDAPSVGLRQLEHVERGHDRDAVFVIDSPQQLHDGVGQGRIETRHRLVGQDHRGRLDQGPGDGHPLLLAARERVDAAGAQLVEADPGEGRLGAGQVGRIEPPSQGPPARGMRQATEHGVLDHGETAQEIELLEDESDAGARAPESLRIGPGHRDAAHLDLARGRGDEPVEAPEQRGLARPARADQRHELPPPDIEIDPVQRPRAPRIVLAEAADADHRRPAVKWKWTW
jgi:hypothetical protein